VTLPPRLRIGAVARGGLLAAALALCLWPAAARADDLSACQVLADVPDSLQVAWVSPLGKRVGASTSLEVVRVGALRQAARETGDVGRLLQVLGIVGRKPSEERVDRGWQVVIFDVHASSLCRPLEDGVAGEDAGGVPVCDDGELRPRRGHRKGWTGCGYSLDTGASARGLDVFRVEWASASAEGFCLMPLQRFLDGA